MPNPIMICINLLGFSLALAPIFSRVDYKFHFRLRIELQGVTNLPPLNEISTPRFGGAGEEVRMGGLQLIFPFPGCFFLRMVAPLNPAKPGDLVSSPPFAGLKDTNWPLHIRHIFLDIDVLRIGLFFGYPQALL